MVSMLIPAVLAVCSPWLAIAVIYAWKWRVDREDRRSPFTKDLLRGPGHSAREKAEDLLYDAFAYLICAWFVPLFFYASYLQWVVYRGSAPSPPGRWTMVIFAAVAFSGLMAKALQLVAVRRQYRLGAQGEQAVGEELNRLLAEGCQVFHDVPADDFNIDHVVVGPAGVFAVETKARRKPIRGRGKEDSKVTYDGERLVFPDWKESRCLEQARRQARWLSKWLTSATGDEVPVTPVLALPGWWVDRKTRTARVRVISPHEKDALQLFLGDDHSLTQDAVQRITHQLDQRCRDVVVKEKPRRRKDHDTRRRTAAVG